MSSGREKRLQEVLSNVSRETVDNLIGFEELFRKWSKAINLASPSTLDQLWERHIVDSAQLFDMAPNALKWLDLGSGGGFPGIVLAILLKQRPGAVSIWSKATARRLLFCAQRLANSPPRDRPCDANRCCMGQNSYSGYHNCPRSCLVEQLIYACGALVDLRVRAALFQKGRDYRREIEESRDAWSFDLVERESAVDKDSVVLQISNLRRTDTNVLEFAFA